VEFDAVHRILLRPCFPFREQMPPFWKKKISKLSQLQVYLDLQYALDICFKKGSGKLTLHYEMGDKFFKFLV
jgi:hypothetical protein